MTEKTIIKKPTVAIVGRTNVGKSTLFNRIIEKSKAIISPIPGTTRSPNFGDATWRGRVFTIVDTGGLEKRTEDPFEADIRRQAGRAIVDADIIVFVVDLRIGITPEDRELGKILVRAKKPIILVGNKAEQERFQKEAQTANWRALGAGDCLPISAVTGFGTGDLLDRVFDEFKKLNIEPKTIEEELHPIKIVIVGKPNVGKSSLLNALVGAERAIVSEIAHTTREPQDTLIRWNENLFLLIDTAGIRKGARGAPSLEAKGMRKTMESIKRANLALFIIDLVEGISAQDKHLAGLLLDAGIGIILVANKWDLVAEKKTGTQEEIKTVIQETMPYLRWAPIIFVSAKTGEHIEKIFNLLLKVADARKLEIPYKKLDVFFRQTIKRQRPLRGKGVRHPFIYNMKQVGILPPAFIVSVRGLRDSVHPSYLKFLENQMREHFDFAGTPIIIKSKTVKPTI